MRFVLASNNQKKLTEMAAILNGLGVEVVRPADLGIHIEVEETGTTFAENAMLKAKAICEASKLPAIRMIPAFALMHSTVAPVCIPLAMAVKDWMIRDAICSF